MTVSAVLARELKAARPALNARLVTAQARSGFDVEALWSFLRERLDPLTQAVDAVAPERTGRVVAAGFDMAVTLTARRVAGMGASSRVAEDTWINLGAPYARLIAEQPHAVLGGLVNAALRIAATPGAHVEQWRTLMVGLAPHATAKTWRALGQIAAWRAGMTHFREGALGVADTLDEATALAAVGGSGSWPAVRAAFAANRWWTPEGGMTEQRVGGFVGFGGPFSQPPELAAGDEGLLVRSGDRCHLIVVDGYGATLHPSGPQAFQAAEARPLQRPRLRDTTVEAADRAVEIALPAEGLTTACDGVTLAVASPFSHYVRLYPWRQP